MEAAAQYRPGISTANAPPQGVNNNSFFAPQIHQLAGSISNSTLAVVDGMRFVGAGGDTLADPNIIPTAAIQRVEVLADGASSIYGSDAVSGVVNFITRKDYEGLELERPGRRRRPLQRHQRHPAVGHQVGQGLGDVRRRLSVPERIARQRPHD